MGFSAWEWVSISANYGKLLTLLCIPAYLRMQFVLIPAVTFCNIFTNLIPHCYVTFIYNIENSSPDWILVFIFRYDFKHLPHLLLFIPSFITSVKSERKMCVQRNTPSLFTFLPETLFGQTYGRRILVCKHRRQKCQVCPMPAFILHLEILFGGGKRVRMHACKQGAIPSN